MNQQRELVVIIERGGETFRLNMAPPFSENEAKAAAANWVSERLRALEVDPHRRDIALQTLSRWFAEGRPHLGLRMLFDHAGDIDEEVPVCGPCRAQGASACSHFYKAKATAEAEKSLGLPPGTLGPDDLLQKFGTKEICPSCWMQGKTCGPCSMPETSKQAQSQAFKDFMKKQIAALLGISPEQIHDAPPVGHILAFDPDGNPVIKCGPAPKPCPKCAGTGREPKGVPADLVCGYCGGSGRDRD